ncbi:hypothetical protein FRC06_008110, partial [Ceratobasidium sp. 370]
SNASTAKSKPKSNSGLRKSRSQSQQSQPRVRVHETNTKANAEQLQHNRERDLKRIVRSPTPGSTDAKPEQSQPTYAQQSVESQVTYVWNTVGYESLVKYTGARLGYDVQGWTEDQILEKLDKIEYIENYEKYKKTPVGNPGNYSSAVVLAPTPIAVGGSWHHDNQPTPVAAPAMSSRPAKRLVDMADTATIKRMHVADPDNTDTESESDPEPVLASTGPHPPPAPPAPPAVHAELMELPNTLTRQSTSTTVPETPLEGQTTSSPSLGSPSAPCFPPLPQPLSPNTSVPRGPVHARLQARVMARDCLTELAMVALGEDVEMVDVGIPETREGTQQRTRKGARKETRKAQAPITYAGYRSHVSGMDNTSVPRTPPPTRANSPPPAQRQPHQPRAPSNSVLAHLECVQMVDTVHDMIRASRTEAMARSRIRRAKPSAPPKTVPQQSSSAAGRPGKKSSCRLEPIAAARADTVEFNKRCVCNDATPFVESVTRQNERRGWCTLREGEQRLQHELLPDNEEDLVHDEALRQGKQPTGRHKKKLSARDFTGIRRQILTLAKVHLFAFAPSEGIYQTRAMFMMWAALVHEATWQMELSGVPYIAATTEELEVMVNYLATLRGKLKERVRPIIGPLRGFNQCVAMQQDVQDNLDLFHELSPNSFHCTSTRPRQGHYEHIDVARCIAAAFFYGPNAVGVLFPDYFEDMPLTIIAFILAI